MRCQLAALCFASNFFSSSAFVVRNKFEPSWCLRVFRGLPLPMGTSLISCDAAVLPLEKNVMRYLYLIEIFGAENGRRNKCDLFLQKVKTIVTLFAAATFGRWSW